MSDTYYKPGLVFKAKEKAQGHSECCFAGAPEIRNADGSLRQESIRPLWAEFGVFGAEYTYEDPITHSTEIGSEFRGGYFNLDEQALEKGWDDREKEIVARHMLQMLPKAYCQFTLYQEAPAQAPWPTYDSTHHNQVPQIAQATGMVAEALRYERQQKNRATVIEKLEDLLKAPVAPVEETELTAA